MSKENYQVAQFHLQGWLLGFVVEDGYKIKSLRLATSEGEAQIKLSKEGRISLFRSAVKPGSWVEVVGERKLKPKNGEIKLKAYIVKPSVSPNQEREVAQVEVIQELPTPAKKLPLPSGVKATILVCKSPIVASWVLIKFVRLWKKVCAIAAWTTRLRSRGLAA
jgi:hypothetical protein